MTEINLDVHNEQLRSGKYPVLATAGSLVKKPEGEILGRDTTTIREAIRNPEKANVVLLGDPGVGKTSIIQKFAYVDASDYLVISLNLEMLVIDKTADKEIEMAQNLEKAASEAAQYSKDNDVIVVLFIDEVHRIAQISPVVVESFKPILEKSAASGFRIIGATTLKEYETWIVPNQALDQRFLRTNVDEVTKDTAIAILKSRANLHRVMPYAEEGIFEEIYDITRRFLPMNAQPRASIDLMLDMVGAITVREYMKDGHLHREYGPAPGVAHDDDKWFNHYVLHRVILRKFHIDVDHRADVHGMRREMTSRIKGQEDAINKVCLTVAARKAGFTDPTKPLSMLFMGPSGVGKTEAVNILSEYLQLPLQRIDLSVFNSAAQVPEFVRLISSMAWQKPNSIILIDEIDKSTNEIMNTMLSVTDMGQLQTGEDGGRVVSFAGNIIIFTTNEGGDTVLAATKNNSSAQPNRSEMLKALGNSSIFSSANLGRIDEVIIFNKLSTDIERMIASKECAEHFSRAASETRRIWADEAVMTYVTNQTAANGAQGAREVKRTLRRLVLSAIAEYMLNINDVDPLFVYVDGRLKNRDALVADLESGDLKVEACKPLEVNESFRVWLERRMLAKHGLEVSLDFSEFCIPSSLEWDTKELRDRYITHIIQLVKSGYRKIKTVHVPAMGSKPAHITFKGE